ncbi:AAA family ATPase [Lactococcus lactis]|uniref:AAA family ATPase n=1 Tax=Lactococcus lactis TaxID=1358 RepID=UPI00315C89BE
MRLKFNNIGKITDGDISIDKISLIAGNNNSGKSTAGKLLFALSRSLNSLNSKNLLMYKFKSVEESLKGVIRFSRSRNHLRFRAAEFRRQLDIGPADTDSEIDFFELESQYREIIEELLKEVEEEEQAIDFDKNENLESAIRNVRERLEISYDSEELKFSQIEKILSQEFTGALTSRYYDDDEAQIELFEDNGDYLKLIYENHTLIPEKSEIKISRDYSGTAYIDDPFILDKYEDLLFLGDESHHRDFLLRTLKMKEKSPNYFEYNFQQKNISEIFSNVLGGKIGRSERSLLYSNSNLSDDLKIDNLSTGTKSFVILKLLIESGQIGNLEYLILDEPEIHLHPKWQLEYAKLIALISTVFPIRILITSHSPYFIEALDIYAEQYIKNSSKELKYYKSVDKGNKISLMKISRDLDDIFEDMYQPLNYLSELRGDLGND